MCACQAIFMNVKDVLHGWSFLSSQNNQGETWRSILGCLCMKRVNAASIACSRACNLESPRVAYPLSTAKGSCEAQSNGPALWRGCLVGLDLRGGKGSHCRIEGFVVCHAVHSTAQII